MIQEEMLENVMFLLQKVDDGYKLTSEERSELSQIQEICGQIPEEMHTLPRSIALLSDLRVVDLSWSEIKDINALSELTNLQELDLSGTEITDVNCLSGLSKLQKLDLSSTKITNADCLFGLTNLQELDLSGTKITNADCLSNLSNLQELDLSDTEITNVDSLSNLSNLRGLNLTDTPLTSVEGLSGLLNLQELNLRGTSVTDADALSGLTNLQELDLSETKITDVDCLSNLSKLQDLNLADTPLKSVEGLSGLPNLQRLNLRETPLTNVDALSGLTNLQSLNLNGTMLTSADALSNLVNLRELFLGATQITNVDILSGLTNLEGLALWGTQITSVESLAGLTKLRILSLLDTHITDISALSGMLKLEQLYLSGTRINSLPGWLGNLPDLKGLKLAHLHLQSLPAELLQLDIPFKVKKGAFNEDGIALENTTLATQPISLFEQPRELIQAYYDADQVPINEAKVIFLGDGGAGKTHTIQRIHNGGKKDSYETETTPGIDITNYAADYSGRKFNIHFWDFGGQEIMHAMHRCFLTDRTCYVVVVSNRWDLNSRARYWLKNIDSFAKGAPVILAINRWDNIEESGIDMSRLTKDYPNLVKQPVYYSAKNSDDLEFRQLIDAIICEAGKLDSTAMSFPVQWAAIRQQLIEMAEHRHYIDKEEYHRICDQQGLESQQIRTWLLEWFNDLGVCFSYHQDETEKAELASYKVLNPRWLTNAIYIIINAGKRYADKGRMNLPLIQDLLGHSELGVLPEVTYSENERDYVLDVMRKFNLSYSVSESLEFIPALCDSETPRELHPADFTKRISYQMEYSYLPDSVVHQLMIRSYKNLNPEKIWRKGLRIDIDWLELSAVVDMGNDDSTLRIDVYARGRVEPWELLHSICKDIADINRNLGLRAEDYIIIHEDNGDILVTVNQLLDAKEQGIDPVPIYNPCSRKWVHYPVDELLGMTFGEKIIAAAVKRAQEEYQPLTEAFAEVKIENINIYHQPAQHDALRIIELLIRNHCETNTRLMECLANALDSTGNEDAKNLAREVKQDHKEKKNFLKRLEEYCKSASSIVTNGKTIHEGVKAVAGAVQTAYPLILETLPEIAETLRSLPPIT